MRRNGGYWGHPFRFRMDQEGGMALLAAPTTPRQHEDAVAARVVRCRSCEWRGTYGKLSEAGCPRCATEAWLEVV